MTVAAVALWGSRIAAVSIQPGARYATFQYDPAFVRSGVQVAPLRMPLREEPYSFSGLPPDAFSGLPGMLADSLPDRWGTALVNAWLASQGREESSFDTVQRLCYVGTRGMGALEFEPAREPEAAESADLQFDALVRLASEVLARGGKLHMQTVGALEHVSYNEPGTYSYEQALLLVRRLGPTTPSVEQLFRRMVFNVVARNQDDHVKNIAFLMDRQGAWSLAPAYDVTWAWKPGNVWLDSHQMSINGKRDNFTVADLRATARVAGLRQGRARAILAEVSEAVAGWSAIAEDTGLDEKMAEQIARSHRLTLPES